MRVWLLIAAAYYFAQLGYTFTAAFLTYSVLTWCYRVMQATCYLGAACFMLVVQSKL